MNMFHSLITGRVIMMRADCGCFLGGGTWHASHLNAGTTQVATRDPKGSAFC